LPSCPLQDHDLVTQYQDSRVLIPVAHLEEAAVTPTRSSHRDKPAEAAQPIVIPTQIRPSESNQLIRLPPNPTATPTWADEIFGKRRVTLE